MSIRLNGSSGGNVRLSCAQEERSDRLHIRGARMGSAWRTSGAYLTWHLPAQLC